MMRYRVYHCAASTCNSDQESCPYWLKVLGCESGLSIFYTVGHHRSSIPSPRRTASTLYMKEEIEHLMDRGYTPVQIRNSLIDIFSLTELTLHPLVTIQNHVYYHRRTYLKNTDLVDDMVSLVTQHQYSTTLSENEAFAFGFSRDSGGRPVIGEGTDDDPCMIAVSTKPMMRDADRPSDSYVFHMDITFKPNKVEYPVFVCGISDKARHFHPIALFITSQRTSVQYEHALLHISAMFKKVVVRSLHTKCSWLMPRIHNTMGMTSLFDAKIHPILCVFFHVMQKVRTRIAGFSKHAKHLVFRHIYEMHYSSNFAEFLLLKTKALTVWVNFRNLANFQFILCHNGSSQDTGSGSVIILRAGSQKPIILANSSTKSSKNVGPRMYAQSCVGW
ncbi:unnamed protein product [Phytophthora fragariaefolia]|uniref:Unnamed protein product n=1 Tax=Phytophthora fragariaefolia TaxID=1490495 RepID=A0A9W6TQC1_9STRA|nr:unnamed protein product [Phytophthora fragariaefolia]